MKLALSLVVVLATLVSTTKAAHDGCISLCTGYNLTGTCTEYCLSASNINHGEIRSVDIGNHLASATVYTSPNYQNSVGTANASFAQLIFIPPEVIRSVSVTPWVEPGCVIIYEHATLGGASQRFCGAHGYVGSNWNDKMSSYLTGPRTTVQFWEHHSSGGNYWVRTGTTYPGRVLWVGSSLNDDMSSLRAFRNS